MLLKFNIVPADFACDIHNLSSLSKGDIGGLINSCNINLKNQTCICGPIDNSLIHSSKCGKKRGRRKLKY